MKDYYHNMPNGYKETIQMGLKAIREYRGKIYKVKAETDIQVKKLKEAIKDAEAIVVGAGAGLSTSAGLTYSGQRFERYFSDFEEKYGIKDIYSGGFYPYESEEAYWGWWVRHIYFNRYYPNPKNVYEDLLEILKDKNYFVITTNVDHMFQLSGFDEKKLFCTQGDYGLFQELNPVSNETFSNEDWVYKAMKSQGFVQDEKGVFRFPEDKKVLMEIPTELIPKSKLNGSKIVMNLRSDENFVEDDNWIKASAAYSDYLNENKSKSILFLELGVGGNTPVIIKYPFWSMTEANPKSIYASINIDEAACPENILNRSICINEDIGAVIKKLRE